jgi:hypothetical protein
MILTPLNQLRICKQFLKDFFLIQKVIYQDNDNKILFYIQIFLKLVKQHLLDLQQQLSMDID